MAINTLSYFFRITYTLYDCKKILPERHTPCRDQPKPPLSVKTHQSPYLNVQLHITIFFYYFIRFLFEKQDFLWKKNEM